MIYVIWEGLVIDMLGLLCIYMTQNGMITKVPMAKRSFVIRELLGRLYRLLSVKQKPRISLEWQKTMRWYIFTVLSTDLLNNCPHICLSMPFCISSFKTSHWTYWTSWCKSEKEVLNCYPGPCLNTSHQMKLFIAECLILWICLEVPFHGNHIYSSRN